MIMENQLAERITTMAEKLKKRSANLTERKQFEEACIILIDVSGSMGTPCENSMTKLENVKQSFQYLHSSNHFITYGLVSFGSSAEAISNPTTNFPALVSLADSLMLQGQTNMADGLSVALELIIPQRSEKKRFILMSDGANNGRDIWEEVNHCKENEVVIDTISFGRDADDVTLKKIAEVTEGKFIKANSPLQLQQAYQQLNYNMRYLENKNGG
jgi:Mg-chelatase subunit ChlD